jgi:hypothetical protein
LGDETRIKLLELKMSQWRDCIVILIDLIGVKKLAYAGDSQASKAMLRFHEIVRQEMSAGLSSLDHAYVWNDAVLLLAYIDGDSHTIGRIMVDASRLKQKVGTIRKSYAIAVKGQSFPTNQSPARIENSDLRVTVLRASSYAMANCFQIESVVKKQRLRMAWYIDERIAKYVTSLKHTSIRVKLLPTGSAREICLYAKDLPVD